MSEEVFGDPNHRVRLYRSAAGFSACDRYFHPSNLAARPAALAELLMWWEGIDLGQRRYPAYVPAMEAGGLLGKVEALRYARNVAVHQSLIMNTSMAFLDPMAPRPMDEVWEVLDEPDDAKKKRGWRAYDEELARRPIRPMVIELDRVFHAVGGFVLPQWLQRRD